MIYAFEDFALDTERRELRRGRDLVPVEPQVFDLLLFLICNRDRVVSKDDLIESVWNGRIVSESALSSRLTAVRQAVNDSGQAQRLIRTVPRKGFRFVADVREEAPVAEPALPNTVSHRTVSASNASPLALAGATPDTVLKLPEKPSIVALPFANLSGDPSQDYFADGMVEDITIALGRLPWLFVIGSTAAFSYKNRRTDARQIGIDLGVRYLLHGSVRKEGNRVRITAELTGAADGHLIWADRFEGELDSVFEMQDQVAAHVSTMIAPALRNVEIERARRKPTENLTAYDLFLRASYQHTGSFEQNEESLRLLYRAIELDPEYSAAYGLAAWCHFWQKVVGWTLPSDPRLGEGIRLAGLASETATNDSEAMWMAGQALTLLAGEYNAALPLIDRSLELNPNAPNAWWASGMAHMFLGDLTEGLEHHQRALRLNPITPWAYYYAAGFAMWHFYAGRYEEAARFADGPLEKEPTFPPMLRLKAAAYGLLGRLDEGRRYVERLRAVNPDASVATIRDYYVAPLRQNPKVMQTILKGLRLSGLPEA